MIQKKSVRALYNSGGPVNYKRQPITITQKYVKKRTLAVYFFFVYLHKVHFIWEQHGASILWISKREYLTYNSRMLYE